MILLLNIVGTALFFYIIWSNVFPKSEWTDVGEHGETNGHIARLKPEYVESEEFKRWLTMQHIQILKDHGIDNED